MGGYRAYNPQTGSFLKQDSYSPFINQKTLNGFDYSAGNPVLNVDNSGHMVEEEIAEDLISLWADTNRPEARTETVPPNLLGEESIELSTKFSGEFVLLKAGTPARNGTTIAWDIHVPEVVKKYATGEIPELDINRFKASHIARDGILPTTTSLYFTRLVEGKTWGLGFWTSPSSIRFLPLETPTWKNLFDNPETAKWKNIFDTKEPVHLATAYDLVVTRYGRKAAVRPCGPDFYPWLA